MSGLYIPDWSEVLAVSHSRGADSEAPHRWDGVVGLWTMLQGGGHTLYDVSGYGNDGLLTGMDPATDWVGAALDFDGSNDTVEAPLSLPGLPLSIATWVYSRDNTWRSTLSLTDATESYGYSLWNAGSASQHIAVSRDSGGDYSATIPAGFTESTWHHLVAVFALSGYSYIYLDGRLEETSGGPFTKDQAVTKLKIGFSPESVNKFNGLVDRVAVYNRALTSDEIQDAFLRPNADLTLRRRVFPSVVAPPGGNRRRRMILFGAGA